MTTTWDGLPVSQEPPFGAAVVVYRQRGPSLEILLLHRAHHGPDYVGDWAWTPPAGSRLPGEPIEQWARRELREETGLDLDLSLTDCGTAEWPHYVAIAPPDATVILDAEHDRFEWAAAADAPLRCLPDLAQRPLEAVIKQLSRPAALEGGTFYDDADVFSTYMRHRAWSGNPNDTIEEPVLLEVLGDVRGLRVLDLGCGDARFGRFLLDAGARSYCGIDASENMVAQAEATLLGLVRKERIEDFSAPPSSVDLIVSRLALHYVDNLESVFERAFVALAPRGRLVFTVEHPVITSSDQGWQGRGPRQAWLVDDYFVTGRREADWLGSRVVKFHRTVEDYVRLLKLAGFRLETLREPRPVPERFSDSDELRRRRRIPLFLLVAAVREAAER